MEDIWSLVHDTLKGYSGGHSLEPGTRLRQDLGLDSLALLNLAVAAEDHFRICLEEDPQNPPETLGEFVALVAQRIQEQRGEP